ncbi:MAG: putative membrane protein [Luteibaculaceae bacterium]|jgi:hypothetical protein
MDTSLIQKVLIAIGLLVVALLFFKIISKLSLVFIALAAGLFIGYQFGKRKSD